jgi:tRNA nucleotidyltransferase (CCA-adding enzyme)
MACNEKEGIIDAFGGMDDLENRVIRAVGNPKKRFSEDALRILRAFRFASQLEFEIEEKTLCGASECAHLLKKISRERVGAEFKKLLLSSGVVYSLQKMMECDVWDKLFPVPMPDKNTICELDKLPSGCFETRLSVLIAHLDDGQKNEFLNSLRLSNGEKKLIIRLCTVKDFEIYDTDPAHCARNFLHYYGDILPVALEVLRFYNRNSEEFVRLVEVENAQKRPLAVSDLKINGSDLLPLCKGDYSRVGKTLSLLLSLVIENPELNEKEKLIEIAKKELE